MKAKIIKIEKSANVDTPQIDIQVEYEDARFPATHQHPEGGKRLQIFTCPESKYETLHMTVLDEMVLFGGRQLEELFPEEIRAEKLVLADSDVDNIKANLETKVGNTLDIT